MNQESKKTHRNPCACFNVCKAERAITQLYDRHLRGIGINAKQLSLISTIGKLENAFITDIAQRMSMDQTTATRNILILEKLGFVERIPHPEDARKKMVLLTKAGNRKRKEAMKLWTTVQNEVVAKLGQESFDKLIALMDTIVSIAE